MGVTEARRASFFVVAFLLLLLFAVRVGAQEEIGSGGIGGRPAFPRADNPRSESIFIHTLDPGQSAQDGINIINNDTETRTIDIYATDSIISSGGAFACEQKVEADNMVGSWVKLSKNSVTLSGGSSEIVPFSITLPELVDIGEHNGCLVVQEVEPETNPESGIGLSFRTAIRLAILVPGEINKSLEIVNLEADIRADKINATTEIENTGNVSSDATITTTLNYLFGQQLSVTGGQFPVLRGQVGEWNFEHTRPFWGGWYQLEVSATYDENPDHFLGDQEGSLTTIGYPSLIFFIWPRPTAAVIELLVLMAVIFAIRFALKHVQRQREVDRDWKSYEITARDDIKSIARAHGISWRHLARANKLRAPYTLEKGRSIKVPPKRHQR